MDRKDIYNIVIAKKLSGGGGGGGDIPQDLKDDMNSVFNKKFSTSTDYSPEVWADTVNLMGVLPTDTAQGAVANFPDGADDVPVDSLVVNIEPVQAGTGDPSPSNPRAISGWAACKVTRTGKNLLNSNASVYYNYTINDDGTENTNNANKRITTDYMECKPNISLTVSGKKVTPNSDVFSFVELVFYDKDKNYISRASSTYTDNPLTATTPSNTAFVRYGEYHNDFTQATPAYFATYQRQVQIGATATVYEPYTTPTEIEISLGQTVYVGTLDVMNGVLTIIGQRYNLGDLAWTLHQNGFYQATKPEDIARCDMAIVPDIIAEKYIAQTGQWVYAHGSTVGYIGQNGGLLYVTDSTTPSGYIVAPLATPVEITLTPEQINTLKGVNNIWADTGDTAVEYRADIQLYIDKKIAEADSNRSLSLTKSAPEEVKEETKEEELLDKSENVDTDNR